MKKLIITLLMFLCMVGVGLAANTVNLDPEGILANASYQDSQTITYGFNVTGNASTWSCTLYSNENGTSGAGTWRAIETDSGVSNNTNTNFTTRLNVAEVSGLDYVWDVFCNATEDSTGVWGGGSNTSAAGSTSYNYSVDVTAPTITATPADAQWDTDGYIIIGATVVDDNADSCILYTTINATDNATQTYGAYPTGSQSFTNNTQFNFTGYTGTDTKVNDNGTGAYIYYVVCNDSAGNSGNTGSNRTIYVDTTAPSAFDFNTSLWTTDGGYAWSNNSYTSDWTPTIGWNATTENNFSRYRLRFYEDNITSSTYVEKNITSRTTLSTAMSTLSGDTTYYLQVTAFDLAGNSVNATTTSYVYNSLTIPHTMYSGWNIFENIGNPKNLSLHLSETGGTTACFYNTTKEFECCTSAGEASCGTDVTSGDAVFIYMSAAGTYNDAVLNSTALDATTSDLTQVSGQSNWSIACNQDHADTNGFNFTELDYTLNGNGTDVLYNNITLMSLFNMSGQSEPYVPYVNNWTGYNGNVATDFGECVWMFNDNNGTTTLNWSAI